MKYLLQKKMRVTDFVSEKMAMEKCLNYWVASMAIPVGKWAGFVRFIYLFIYFFVSVKVLPVTPLVSGVFVHRAFCAYFLRI